MLCYAWNVLKIKDTIKVGVDDIKDSYNLLALVFLRGVSKIIRRGFHKSYIESENALHYLKGKINIQKSIEKMTLVNKMLVCNYDEYETNDTFNQIVKYTISSLVYGQRNKLDPSIKRDFRRILPFFDGVDSIPPSKENISKLIFSKNNEYYRLLISVAQMLYYGNLPNEESQDKIFDDFFRDKQMPKVFEKFIFNFYLLELDRDEFYIHPPHINWVIREDKGSSFQDFFDVELDVGDRRTDVAIENKKQNSQIIIDAKFYSTTFVGGYMSQDDKKYVRTAHINQVRGYVLDSRFKGDKIGALIYPEIDVPSSKILPLKDAPIIVKTINLADEWQNIKEDMISFVVDKCKNCLEKMKIS